MGELFVFLFFHFVFLDFRYSDCAGSWVYLGGPPIVCWCSATCTDGVPSVSTARPMRMRRPPKSHRAVNCRPPIVGLRGILSPRRNPACKGCVSALSAMCGDQSPCEYTENSDQSVHGLRTVGASRASHCLLLFIFRWEKPNLGFVGWVRSFVEQEAEVGITER